MIKIRNGVALTDKEIEKVTRRLYKKTKVDANGCWVWFGCTGHDGYGRINIKMTTQKVHRLSYMLNKGPIGDSMVIGHTCSNHTCVNPEHLVEHKRKGRKGGNASWKISRESGFDKGKRSAARTVCVYLSKQFPEEPMAKLWLSILCRAVLDLTSPNKDVRSDSERWFNKGMLVSGKFGVCSAFGVDEDWVKETLIDQGLL